MTFTNTQHHEEPAFAGQHMSHDCAQAFENRASDLEKLSFYLSRDNASREFNCALRWIIFRIVDENRGITFVQLKKILRGEYGVDKRVLDTAISSLTSPTMLNALTKWRNPRMEDVGAEIGIHLNVRDSDMCTAWKTNTLRDFPELASFQPPVLQPARSTSRKVAG